LGRKFDVGRVFEAFSDVASELEAAEGAVVGLVGVAGDDHFRAASETGQDAKDHFWGELLGLIEQDEGADEGAAAGPANGEKLQGTFSEVLHQQSTAYELAEVIEGAAGEGGELIEQFPGQGAEVFLEGGGDAADDVDLVAFFLFKQFQGGG